MGLILPRRVRRLASGPQGESGDALPLAAFRGTPAHVLLGDPGAGKTTAFHTEEAESGGSGLFVSARDFLTLDPVSHPEWQTKTLFLDGLDEVRVGKSDARTPFDAIRLRLDQLGKPRFRLSCRDADWLGANDREHLKAVSPDGEVVVLRLEPLTDEDIRAMVGSLLGDGGSVAFLRAAADRGLEGLLRNPQTLDLLARVFGRTGEFPSSRLETFEQATALLAQEPNEEHQIGGPDVPLESILDAAGRLSAVQLLSGTAGHCLRDRDATPGYIPISAHGEDLRPENAAALRTRLFMAEGNRRFRPVHANVAAFLAARTLARLVEDGLPQRRVLALLAGDDGAPPTPLRGLVAWLAALSRKLRRPLVERDAAAVLMYGDVRDFTAEEKTGLLDQLAQDPSRLHESAWPASAVEALASPDMAPAFEQLLADSDRSDSKQRVVRVVATALRNGPPLQELAESLRAVSSDDTRCFRVRRAALDAWIHLLAKAPNRIRQLRQMLAEVQRGDTQDSDSDLLGLLLSALYPDAMSPSEVWDYFDPPTDLVFNNFYIFWKTLASKCPDQHLSQHLDHLAERMESLPVGLRQIAFSEVPLSLLARALKQCGRDLHTERLAQWLRLGLDARGSLDPQGRDGPNAAREVNQWLERHPDAQKAVIAFALRREDYRRPGSGAFLLNDLLYGSRLPDDIGHWHFDEAVAAEEPQITETHLCGFLEALSRKPVQVDRQLARARRRLRDRPDALRFLDSKLRSPLPQWRIRQGLERLHLRKASSQQHTRLLEAVRTSEGDLRENRASPRLLNAISRLYHGGEFVRGAGGRPDRLVEALGGDESLVRAAMEAMRNPLARGDLPSDQEILELRRNGRISSFVLPVVTSLREMDRRAVRRLNDAQMRTALACRLCFHGFAQEADWYSACVRDRPDLVAEVLVLFARGLLRSGRESFSDFQSLEYSPEYAEVARRATPDLLRAFPVRARTEQLRDLDSLLLSGLQHMSPRAFRQIVEAKLGRKNMTKTQRARWLAAGIVLDPDMYLSDLSKEMRRSEHRANSVEQFFERPGVERPHWLMEKLTPAAMEFLIRALGTRKAPLIADMTVRSGVETSLFIQEMLTRLSHSPERLATAAISRLVADPGLVSWREDLERAGETQRVVRRDAAYRVPAAEEVIEALRNGPPAAAADLRALVVDRLERISKELRTTNANLWRQFWNEASKPSQPKHENACRDALLAMLRPRLPAGCDAQPEGQYAGNRRADIRTACGEWSIPVEIKKNRHSDMWRAVGNPLLPRYANDPATEGLGIYLVLWFGPKRTAPAAEGGPPGTPDELRERLLGGLKEVERRRAAVVVMDVTPP